MFLVTIRHGKTSRLKLCCQHRWPQVPTMWKIALPSDGDGVGVVVELGLERPKDYSGSDVDEP